MIEQKLLSLVLTFLGTVLFIAGIYSFRALRRLDPPAESLEEDTFRSSISLAFATGERSPEFRRRQRQTVLYFSAAILLLYVGRFVVLSATQ